MHAMRIHVLVILALALSAWGAEDVLYFEQTYSLVQADKMVAKDVVQKVYVARDWVRIEEYEGAGEEADEVILIDLRAEQIVTMKTLSGKKVKKTVSFEKRRESILRKIENAQENLGHLSGEERETYLKLNRALLDAGRRFVLKERGRDEPKTKEILGLKAERATVRDEQDGYEALEAWLHPEIRMPADSAEILYLMQLIGGNLKAFLEADKARFRRLPLEMQLDAVGGGTLHTKVTRYRWLAEPKTELSLVPEDYQEQTAYRRIYGEAEKPADPDK